MKSYFLRSPKTTGRLPFPQRSRRSHPRGVVLLALLLVFALLLGGCRQRVSMNQSLSVLDLMQESEKMDAEQVQKSIETETVTMERMYLNGLIDEDFSLQKAQMDRALEAHMEGQLRQYTSAPLFVKCDMEYYNDTLKKVRDAGWGIDQVLADNQNGIRNGEFIAYIFDPEIEYTEAHQKITELLAAYKGSVPNILARCQTNLVLVDPKALHAKSLEDWRADPSTPASFSGWEMLRGKTGRIKQNNLVLEILKQRHNEEFVMLYTSKRTPHAFNVCAPRRDPSLRFETTIYDADTMVSYSKYLTVLAQKVMGELVQKAIVEEGLQDKMVCMVIPGAVHWSITDLNSYDTGSIETEADKRRFLREGYEGSYDVNLVYLKEKDEAVDLSRIRSVVDRVKAIVPQKAIANADATTNATNCIVTLYTLKGADIPIAVKLFQRERTPSWFFKPESMRDVLPYTRVETDGYHFLDIYRLRTPEEVEMKDVLPEEHSTESTTGDA